MKTPTNLAGIQTNAPSVGSKSSTNQGLPNFQRASKLPLSKAPKVSTKKRVTGSENLWLSGRQGMKDPNYFSVL
jgi:hypothetical protein